MLEFVAVMAQTGTDVANNNPAPVSVLAHILEYVAVMALGGLVGIGELVSRYRDAPGRALKTIPALFYIALNMGAAAGALFLLTVLKWVPENKEATVLVRVLASGFGAMAVFRTSLFTVRVNGQDVPMGPSGFLQVVLSAADRAVDRARATARSKAVAQAMTGVSFQSAYQALPTFCIALMQNLSKEDQATLARDIAAVQASNMDPQIKALALGLALMNQVGESVLVTAISQLPQLKIAALVTVSPMRLEISLKKGGRFILNALAKDQSGTLIIGKQVAWTTSDPGIATVDAMGHVVGIAAGEVLVTATADDAVSNTASISVVA